MRIVPLLSPIALATCLVACSEPNGTAAANTVDVAAAAARGQSDIANYAAAAAVPPAPAEADATVPLPAASASPSPQPSPTSIGVEEPQAVVRRYLAAIGARHYAEAWHLWEDDGVASGMTEAAFAASLARYASFTSHVGLPTDEDAGAGQRFVTVPATVTGLLRSGAPFRLTGRVVLHRVADGIDSDDPADHQWRIRNSEMKPRPADGE